jgi:hypothetical protein
MRRSRVQHTPPPNRTVRSRHEDRRGPAHTPRLAPSLTRRRATKDPRGGAAHDRGDRGRGRVVRPHGRPDDGSASPSKLRTKRPVGPGVRACAAASGCGVQSVIEIERDRIYAVPMRRRARRDEELPQVAWTTQALVLIRAGAREQPSIDSFRAALQALELASIEVSRDRFALPTHLPRRARPIGRAAVSGRVIDGAVLADGTEIECRRARLRARLRGMRLGRK